MGAVAADLARVPSVIVVVAALKGGVGKTTTAVYLAAAAANGKRSVTLVVSVPQGSAADWVEHGADEVLESLEVVEANPILDVRNASAAFAVELVQSAFGKRIL